MTATHQKARSQQAYEKLPLLMRKLPIQDLRHRMMVTIQVSKFRFTAKYQAQILVFQSTGAVWLQPCYSIELNSPACTRGLVKLACELAQQWSSCADLLASREALTSRREPARLIAKKVNSRGGGRNRETPNRQPRQYGGIPVSQESLDSNDLSTVAAHCNERKTCAKTCSVSREWKGRTWLQVLSLLFWISHGHCFPLSNQVLQRTTVKAV